MDILEVVVGVMRLVLATVFFIALLAKLAGQEALRAYLRHLGVPRRFLAPGVWMLLMAELAAVMLLLAAPGGLAGSATIALYLVFTGAVVRGAGNVAPCGCFGRLSGDPLGSPIWRQLFPRLTGVAAGVVVLVTEGEAAEWLSVWSVTIALLAIVVFVVSLSARSPERRSPTPLARESGLELWLEQRLPRRNFLGRVLVLAVASFADPVIRLANPLLKIVGGVQPALADALPPVLFRDARSASGESSSSSPCLSILKPSSLGGDVLIAKVQAVWDSDGTDIWSAVSPGWTKLSEEVTRLNASVYGGKISTTAVFWKLSTESEPTSFQFNYSPGKAGYRRAIGTVLCYGGENIDPVSPIVGASISIGTSKTIIAPPLSGASIGDVLLGLPTWADETATRTSGTVRNQHADRSTSGSAKSPPKPSSVQSVDEAMSSTGSTGDRRWILVDTSPWKAISVLLGKLIASRSARKS